MFTIEFIYVLIPILALIVMVYIINKDYNKREKSFSKFINKVNQTNQDNFNNSQVREGTIKGIEYQKGNNCVILQLDLGDNNIEVTAKDVLNTLHTGDKVRYREYDYIEVSEQDKELKNEVSTVITKTDVVKVGE